MSSSIDHINIVLQPGAIAPACKSELAAGYDLFACEDKRIMPRQRGLVQTGVSIEIPRGYYGRVASRSGLALNCGINVGAGVIDADYRGQIGVLLFNDSDEPYDAQKGSRIAQLIIEKIITPPLRIVAAFASETERGAGGFGSTGSK